MRERADRRRQALALESAAGEQHRVGGGGHVGVRARGIAMARAQRGMEALEIDAVVDDGQARRRHRIVPRDVVGTAAGDGEYKLTGELTIKDVTRPVTLDLEYLGSVDSPFGDTRAGFSASTEINRKDWGLGWNVALEAGGVVVGDKIKINIDAETILQK